MRSHWGWGDAAHLPDAAEREWLRQQLSGALGWSLTDPQPYPQLADARLPAPRVAIPPALAAFSTADRRGRATRTYGRAFPDLLRGFQGDFSAAPDFIAQPREEADIRAVLDWAAAAGVAVVPYGGGTSVVGGVECRGEGFTGVVCLDLGCLDQVLEVDARSMQARIQAGARGPALEAQLAPHGLSLRHYPQSFTHSTLGGWIATRAGGHFATRYTHIDDLVASVRMVTATGVWDSRRLPGSGAGPSPDRMILGSEGILGVITEAWVRVFARPIHRSKASVHFDDFLAAADAVREIAQARLYPSNCRLLDPHEAMLNLVAFGKSVLLLGFESATHSQAPLLDEALSIAARHSGVVAEGPTHTESDAIRKGGGQAWRSAFLKAPYRQSALLTLGVIADTFETAITWDRFPALHKSVTAAVKSAGAAMVSCRFTHVYPDGPAPYYTFLLPCPVHEMLPRWQVIKDAAGDALIRSGATITHHHAVGRTHRPWYDQQRPEPFAQALRAAKDALDPAGVLNPGVLLPRRASDPAGPGAPE